MQMSGGLESKRTHYATYVLCSPGELSPTSAPLSANVHTPLRQQRALHSPARIPRRFGRTSSIRLTWVRTAPTLQTCINTRDTPRGCHLQPHLLRRILRDTITPGKLLVLGRGLRQRAPSESARAPPLQADTMSPQAPVGTLLKRWTR